MRSLQLLALGLVLALLGTSCTSNAQPSGDALSNERILENLKLELPQLQQAQSLQLGPMTSSAVEGFQQTTLIVNERNQVPLLVRDDGEQVLLLAAPPVSTGRTLAEVQAQRAAADEERRATLADATAPMPVRGNAEAPVTMTVFSDFQCPYCARSISLIEGVMDTYPDTVNFVFMHYPLPNHGWAKPAAIAAQCAARQSEDAFWTLHDAYFDDQGQITEANVINRSARYLAGADLDLEAWQTCATDEASSAHQVVAQIVDQSMRTGEQLGVRGTPTFFIDGQAMRGPRSVEAFGQRIEAAAAAQ